MATEQYSDSMNNLNRFNFPHEFVSITAEQAEEYVDAASQRYTSSLPYHNWDHARDVIRGTETITQKLSENGVISAAGALAVAAAWHDAGYQENHITKGFLTKEDYSSFLLESFLEGKPVGKYEKDVMLRAIKETWIGHKELRTPTPLILHRADIANIGGPTEAFIENTKKLWAEEKFTSGDGNASWDQFIKKADYFVRFTSAEHDYESLSHGLDAHRTTLDVNDTPFGQAVDLNLEALRSLEPQD